MKSRHATPYVSAIAEGASFKPRPVAALVWFAFAIGAGMGAAPDLQAGETNQNVEFDTTFLQLDANRSVDVSRFAHGNLVSPGVYTVDIFVNDNRIARNDIRFVASSDRQGATPCFTRSMLEGFGVDFAKIAAEKSANTDAQIDDACFDVSAHIPGAAVDFDFAEQKISLSIPQKYMRQNARGYVPPELWDTGVNAGFLNYNANAYEATASGVRSTQGYLGLNAGVNVGGWHFRHQSSISASTGQATQFDNISTFVQHDLPKLKSQATLGDAQTTGDVFDSVAFRGAQIATDDRMLPESLRGYAPVVRGTADSNARVTVRQNGQVIFETSVPPGPFEINDLYATGYGGNLDVTVTEADGRTKRFTVPYAAVAQSLRPGSTRFAFTAGQLRDESLQTKPAFVQMTMQRGLTNLVTLYGGTIAAQGYIAANMGAALNTKVGAFSADVTMARTEIPGSSTSKGQSLRLAYSKFIDATNTNFTLGAYRYSDAGYFGFADAARASDYAEHGGDISDRQRGRTQLTINQPLKNNASVFATASAQTYWNRAGRDLFFQAGYSNSFKYGTYSLTAGRTANSDGTVSNEIMLSTTIPLGRSQHAPQLTTNLNAASHASSMQASLSGSAGANNQYSYNVYGAANQGSGSNIDASAGASGVYRGPVAQVSASMSGGANSSQASAGVSGSIVAHPGGVTFSQTVGDTFGIVEAKGAEGATVSGSSGARIDSRGYAVVPYMTPYSMNSIDIDPKGASSEVEFESTSERASPHFGSVVMLKYKTVTGRAALIRAPRMGGEALPFGAEVTDAQGRVVGVVAQDSRIFVRGIEDSGTLHVQWGEAAANRCAITYSLPADKGASKPGGAGYASIETHCLGTSLVAANARASAALF